MCVCVCFCPCDQLAKLVFQYICYFCVLYIACRNSEALSNGRIICELQVQGQLSSTERVLAISNQFYLTTICVFSSSLTHKNGMDICKVREIKSIDNFRLFMVVVQWVFNHVARLLPPLLFLYFIIYFIF